MSSRLALLCAACTVSAGITYYLMRDDSPPTEATFDELGIEPPFRVVQHPGFRVIYDCQSKIPVAVEERLDPATSRGEASRSRSRFHEEESVRSNFRSTLADYYGSYGSIQCHRGHMAPAGDFKGSQESMDASFSLTNVLPQDGDNNQDLWNTFEEWVRELVRSEDYETVRVVSGGLIIPSLSDEECLRKNVSENEIRDVSFVTIGPHRVSKPTHLYKLICCEPKPQIDPWYRRLLRRLPFSPPVPDHSRDSSRRFASAFIMPNEASDDVESRMADYEIPISQLEELSGLTFGPLSLSDAELANLDLESESEDPHFPQLYQNLCAQHPACYQLSKKEYDTKFLSQKLERARKSGWGLSGLASIENQASRKKLTAGNFDGLEEEMLREFEAEIQGAVSALNEENDACLAAVRLMDIDRVAAESSVLQNAMQSSETARETIIDALKVSLKKCQEEKVRKRAARVVKSTRWSEQNSILKSDEEFVKILDL